MIFTHLNPAKWLSYERMVWPLKAWVEKAEKLNMAAMIYYH